MKTNKQLHRLCLITALKLCVVTQLFWGSVAAEEKLELDVASEVSIATMREKVFSADLVFEKSLYAKNEFNGDLYSYRSDGLKVYALVNTPNRILPEAGFPILIYGHGFHPQPKKYGINAEGLVSRPGDYYRGIPERYASAGYLVITPDYRGHNISEGFKYTQRNSLSSSYYASDVLHLLSALPRLPRANAKKVFYAGHSMGGDVGLKVMLVSNKLAAASLWSPAVGSTAQKALYYGRYYDEDKNTAVDSQKMSEYKSKIDQLYEELPVSVSPQEVDAISQLNHLTTPLIIHHARGDRSVPYQWAENLVVEMNDKGKEFLFYSYDTSNHLFEGKNLDLAFKRDLEFFSNF